jgi:hypothetical protein
LRQLESRLTLKDAIPLNMPHPLYRINRMDRRAFLAADYDDFFGLAFRGKVYSDEAG